MSCQQEPLKCEGTQTDRQTDRQTDKQIDEVIALAVPLGDSILLLVTLTSWFDTESRSTLGGPPHDTHLARHTGRRTVIIANIAAIALERDA